MIDGLDEFSTGNAHITAFAINPFLSLQLMNLWRRLGLYGERVPL